MKRLTSLLVSAVALQVPVAALATEHFEAVERALTDATLTWVRRVTRPGTC